MHVLEAVTDSPSRAVQGIASGTNMTNLGRLQLDRLSQTLFCVLALPVLFQISRITGMIIGRRPVLFWINRFSSTRTRSFTMP